MKHPNPEIETQLRALASKNLPVIELSLGRVLGIMKVLGEPQKKLPPVLHVAGTNGKGSLIAYLTAILQAAGYKVHRYISPYLVRANEQILLAGKEIEDAEFLPLLKRVAAAAEKHPVTYFEALTVAGFLAFCETPADIVLLETGLGGSFDATNIIDAPALTAITPISMDHTEFLGNSLTAIAGEKAGIIKQGVACVVGPQEEEALAVIARAAKEKSTSLYRYSKEWQVKETGTGFHYRSSVRDALFPLPNLIGGHQIRNAATAIACIDRLKDFSVSSGNIIAGITHAVWPARLQHLTSGALVGLLPTKTELWLDGGHNPQAGEILADWVKKQDKPVHLILGMLANKDAAEFLRPLSQYIASLIAIDIPSPANGQSQSPEILSQIALDLSIRSSVASDVRRAIQHIVKENENDCKILICGSLYLAGNILWQNNKTA